MGFQHPPVRGSPSTPLLRKIHDRFAEGKEQSRRKRLGEEICHVVGTSHEGDSQVVGLDFLTDEEMASVD
eukprot:3931095-Pleurochrysis_carterae.AAC.1